jgi:hypothetical protein
MNNALLTGESGDLGVGVTQKERSRRSGEARRSLPQAANIVKKII